VGLIVHVTAGQLSPSYTFNVVEVGIVRCFKKKRPVRLFVCCSCSSAAIMADVDQRNVKDSGSSSSEDEVNERYVVQVGKILAAFLCVCTTEPGLSTLYLRF